MCVALQDILWGSQYVDNARFTSMRLMSILYPQLASSHHVRSWFPQYLKDGRKRAKRGIEKRNWKYGRVTKHREINIMKLHPDYKCNF